MITNDKCLPVIIFTRVQNIKANKLHLDCKRLHLHKINTYENTVNYICKEF